MKVLLINGSPHKNGSTHNALSMVAKEIEAEGIETEIFHVGNGPVRPCVGCMYCKTHEWAEGEIPRCAFKGDRVAECTEKILEADGIIIGAPVYYGMPAGGARAFFDRAFYPIYESIEHKLAASITCLRRAGGSATVMDLNNYFINMNMHIVSSSYWPVVHGYVPEEQQQDEQGIECMQRLGKNMAWLLKCIHESGIEPPKYDHRKRTSFVREGTKPSWHKV